MRPIRVPTGYTLIGGRVDTRLAAGTSRYWGYKNGPQINNIFEWPSNGGDGAALERWVRFKGFRVSLVGRSRNELPGGG